MFYKLFNITVEMDLSRTLIMCAVTAAFFIIAALVYDASALIDKPVRRMLTGENA